MFAAQTRWMVVALTLLTVPLLFADEPGEIVWRKVRVDCRRTKTKSSRSINRNKGEAHKDDEEEIEHIKISATLKSSMKETVEGLKLEVHIIAETAAKSSRDRKPVAGPKKLTTGIKLEPYKKVQFIAIETKLSVKEEAVGVLRDGKAKKDTKISGQTYDGYVALLKDANDKLLMVKAENTKVRRTAQELGIVPKEIELSRKGVVEYEDEDEDN